MRVRHLVIVTAFAVALSGCAGEVAPSASPSATVTPTATVTPSAATSPTASPSPSPSDATPSGETAASATPTADPESSTQPSAQAQGSTTPPNADIDHASSITVVVNKRRPMQPADYAPALVAVSIAQDGDERVTAETNAGLVELDAAMRTAIGEGVHVFSSYRSYARQTQLYNGYVASSGQAAADTTSARPGHSEHQTGLAVDVVGSGGACQLNTCFGDTAAGTWLAEHAWEHGFILRYPNGLDGTTGYAYEPWHFRFIGVDAAAAMHASGAQTLEAYFGLPDAPNYG